MLKRPKKKILYGIFLLLPLVLGIVGYIYQDHFRDFYRFFRLVPLSHIEVTRPASGETLQLTRRDGIHLAATLYRPEKKKPIQNGILLLHGNTPIGREHPLFRLMASKLVERGFLVLTLDFAGFGDSGDPFAPGTPQALNPERDVRTGLDYLTNLPEMREKSIYIIGHSGGCPSGLQVGLDDPAVAGMVAIGPPRRVRERLNNPKDRDAFWKEAQRFYESLYEKQFPEWYTKEMWVEQAMTEGTSISLQWDLHAFLPYFSRPGHKPLFLIDSEFDSQKDKLYLQHFYDRLSQPKEYLTLKQANHYLNTKAFKRWILYDQPVMEQAIGAILDWMDRHSQKKATAN